MSKTKKSKKKKWYETGEFADGYQLWDFYKTFKNKKNNEKKDAKKKSVSQDIKESKNKEAQNTTTYLPRVENGKVSFDPVVQFYGFKNEEERQNYIKENPDLYVANGGFKYEPSVLQKNYASISDKEKKNAVEAAKGVVESNKRQEFLSDFGVNKPGKISNNAFARLCGFSNESEMNAYKQKYPELYEALGGVKYVPYGAPLANKKGYINSKAAEEKVVKRYENYDIVKIEEIIKKLNNNEWQDADTMEKYSDIVNNYVNDYIALSEMGYFNHLPEEEIKDNIELMNQICNVVNNQKKIYGNYESAYDYNTNVKWKNKYGSMTWEELETEEREIRDVLLKKYDSDKSYSLQELRYVENIFATQNKDVWDKEVSFKKLSFDERNDVLSDVKYGKSSYEYAEECLEKLKKESLTPEDIDEYKSFVKEWYNQNGTVNGAREAYGISKGYLNESGRYERIEENSPGMLDFADTMISYEIKYGSKSNLDELEERLIKYHENAVTSEEFFKYYTKIKTDPKADKYITQGKKIYKTKDENITDEEYEVVCYYLGKGERNYYFTWLEDVVYKREIAASGGWSSVYDGESLKYHRLWSDYTKDAPLEAEITSVALNLGSGAEFLYNTLNGNVTESKLSKASSKIREARTNQIDIEIAGWDAFDFVYNTGMSMADSVASMALGGKVGGIAQGLSAAAQATNNALDRGMDNKKAFWNGIISGAFEAIFETYSIGNLYALKETAGAGFKTVIKNIGKSMLTNASEEMLTEIANIVYDTIANGDFSQYAIALKKYKDMGLSEKEARLKAAVELGSQVVEAAASGALMGIGFGGFGSAVSSAKTINYANSVYGSSQSSINSLIQNGLAMPEGSAAYSQAVKSQAKVDSGKKVSGTALYNLATAIQSEIETKSQARLNELGVDKKTVKELAPIVAKAVFGENLTLNEQSILKDSRYGIQVANELLADKSNTIWRDEKGVTSHGGVTSFVSKDGSIKTIPQITEKDGIRTIDATTIMDEDAFIEGLWEGSRKSKNDENEKNVEKSQLETFDNDNYDWYNKNNIIIDGSHLVDGKLKPNVKYKSGEFDYIYSTDGYGRISGFATKKLQFTKRIKRLKHNSNTYDKQKGDHAGHLIADRFGGSKELDNLVSQSALVNLSEYKKVENIWANALKNNQKVEFDVQVQYEGNSKRPSSFIINFSINGRMFNKTINN